MTLDELAPKLVDGAVEVLGASGAVLYLAEPDGGLHAAAAVGTGCPAPTLTDDDHAPFAPLLLGHAPVVLENGSAAAWCWLTEARVFTEGSAIVPLHWGHDAIGALVLGEPREGSYTADDLGLMRALGEDVAGLIVAVQRSESRTRAREYEAFHRFTSFVVHDLKSSIAALSALSEGALKSVDDRGLPRDALDTVAQTVSRMKSVLGRLQDGAGATWSLRMPSGERT
ncbi:MAG TPA: GAF domain-containing protein [Methylomirabilota bacterium]